MIQKALKNEQHENGGNWYRIALAVNTSNVHLDKTPLNLDILGISRGCPTYCICIISGMFKFKDGKMQDNIYIDKTRIENEINRGF